jgi:hypothetical protein
MLAARHDDKKFLIVEAPRRFLLSVSIRGLGIHQPLVDYKIKSERDGGALVSSYRHCLCASSLVSIFMAPVHDQRRLGTIRECLPRVYSSEMRALFASLL